MNISFNKHKIFQFLKFCIVGLSNTVIAYTVYYLLVSFLNTHYIPANIAAFFISVLNSFFWNNKFVFKTENGHKGKMLLRTYISYGFTGLILSNILLFILVGKLNISKYIAPFLTMIVTVPLNFILNKFWAFKAPRS
jgi:putative flippase GtrA